ncbi:MAG: ParB N-terminal domain-containing protein [Chloroherpetonaceae bacterium]
MKKKTKDYKMFKFFDSNRELQKGLVDKLIKSISLNNLLEFRPILVDKDFKIIDGQHRLEAAKKLQVDIYYEIQKELKAHDIILLNENQKAWSTEDYINFYANENYIEYIKLKNYIKEKNINIWTVFVLLGKSISKTKVKKIITSGKFIFPTGTKLEEINNLIFKINNIKEMLKNKLIGNKKFVDQIMFHKALVHFLSFSFINYNTFYKKLEQRLDLINRRATDSAYIELFKAIYNYKNIHRINEIEWIEAVTSKENA